MVDSGRKQKYVRDVMLCGIFILFWATRLWQLTSLPYGLHIDEAGMAYDAWCLSQYGVDRYLKPWPVYLTNLGGGQSSLYAFLCAFLFRIFGYSVWMVRLPAVLFSCLNLVFGMKLTEKLYPRRTFLPVAVGGLLTICPYFIMASRFGYDCNLMLGMSSVFLYCFVTAVESGKIGRYIAAGATGGILLYTYALTYMILPLFLIMMLVYLIQVKRFLFRGWIAMAVPLGLLAVPLILVQIVNFFDLEEFQIGCFTITKLQRYRASEVGLFGIKKFCAAVFCIFFGDFLEEPLQYNSAPGFANLYILTLLFCLLGTLVALKRLWSSVKRRELDLLVVVLLWAAGIVFLESHIPANVNRINGVFTAVILLAVEGMDVLIHFRGEKRRIPDTRVTGAEAGIAGRISAEKTEKEVTGKGITEKRVTGEGVTGRGSAKKGLPVDKGMRWIAAVLTAVYTICFIRFSVYYYGGRYTVENSLLPYFDITMSEAVEFIEQNETLREKETQMAQVEIFFALSTLESPYVLNIGQGDGMSYGRYHFGGLGEIKEDYNYVVWEGFEEYSENLRAAGFEEQRYEGYSLFYKDL